MNEGRESEVSDVSAMMDLFRSEVKRHALTIHDGLQAMAAHPENTDRLQAMIPAIQAIKGGAQIIDLDRAAVLAQTMKNIFAAAEKGEFLLDDAGLKLLFEGVEILNHMAEEPREGEAAWIDANGDVIDAWVKKAEFSPAAEAPDATPPPVKDPVPGPAAVGVPSGDPLSSTAEDASGEGEDMALDPAMCELFRTETQNHVAILNDGLLSLEQNPTSAEQLEALMRAAHSIKGAARIVGLDHAAHMAHAMEDCFVAAQKGRITFNSGKIDILFKGVDMLNRISEQVGKGGSGWFGSHEKEIKTVEDAITGIVAPGSDPVVREPQPKEPPLGESPRGDEREHDGPPREERDKPPEPTAAPFAADPAMLDLFQAEVETHVAVLNDGLLALENNPGATDQLEALMRAAHSH